jgi:hypothetical protein
MLRSARRERRGRGGRFYRHVGSFSLLWPWLSASLTPSLPLLHALLPPIKLLLKPRFLFGSHLLFERLCPLGRHAAHRTARSTTKLAHHLLGLRLLFGR